MMIVQKIRLKYLDLLVKYANIVFSIVPRKGDECDLE